MCIRDSSHNANFLHWLLVLPRFVFLQFLLALLVFIRFFCTRFAAKPCYHRVCYKWFAAPLAFSLYLHILVAFNFVDFVSTRLTISHSVSRCVFYSGSAHSHSISHRVQDVAMMSAKCPLNCSAVELWYKIILEIRNQSDLTENHIKTKATGYQRLYSKWL